MGVPNGPVPGIAPNCSATVYSIYREGAEGEIEPSSQAALALAINRAMTDGADIINVSSGQLTPTGEAQRILAMLCVPATGPANSSSPPRATMDAAAFRCLLPSTLCLLSALAT
jgi:hypothetical protein